MQQGTQMKNRGRMHHQPQQQITAEMNQDLKEISFFIVSIPSWSHLGHLPSYGLR